MEFIGLSCDNGSLSRYDVYTPGTVITITALGLIDLAVVLGNSLVIAAVITTRKLRTVTNIFIVSLACADLLLGFAVLPFSISVEVLKLWVWGSIWCSMWLAIDVWLCTASILSLCAISLDRYIAVTHPIKYPSIVSPNRGKILVSIVWILAFVICLPPLLGWNDTVEIKGDNSTISFSENGSLIYNTVIQDNVLLTDIYSDANITFASDLYAYPEDFVTDNNESYSTPSCKLIIPTCELTPTKGYRIYAAMGSFFIPMFVLIFFYFRIYLAAMKTAASLRKGILKTRPKSGQELPIPGQGDETIQLRVHRGGSTNSSQYSFRKRSSGKFPEYSNGSPSANRHLSNMSRSSASRSSEESIIHDRLASKQTIDCNGTADTNNPIIADTNNPITAEKGLLVLFGSVSKRLKKVRKNKNKSKRIECDDTELEVLNTTSNGKKQAVRENSNGLYEGILRDKSKKTSPRRYKLIIKETKASLNAKGHARKFRRETKAAKTLAIIVGAFIVCWLPFFTIYLLGAFCHDCVSDIVFSVFFWLGYCNSALNPCIYAMFARDFRFAFKHLLSCRKSKRLNSAARADYITGGLKKTLAPPHCDFDSASDQ